MNKMLVAVFKDETTANSGLQALHRLHSHGDITLYAGCVVVKDAKGTISVKRTVDDGAGPTGTITGLAVGSLIGLLGGPPGVALGAASGTLVGARRDFWAAGVGLDFLEEAESFLHADKVGLVAEIDEEWVTPVDSALESLGGQIFRRTRSEVLEAHLDQEISALKTEVKSLEDEAAHATSEAKAKLHSKGVAAKSKLDAAVKRGQARLDSLKDEADAKTELLKNQLNQAKDGVKQKIEDRVKRVKGSYHARGEKLSQAWHLAKEAIAL